MFRRHGSLSAAVALGLVQVLATGCGGAGAPGSPSSANTPHPLVRQFSPTMSPINFETGQAAPTYTDPWLTTSTDPAYPGQIVIFFQTGTRIDPASIFIGGSPVLGVDLSAIQILQFVPGTGNVPLEASSVDVLDDRIVFTPAVLPLALGQYSIGVFANVKSIEGDPVERTPVFHSFTVGTVDSQPPIVVATNPANAQQNVGAGIPPPPPPSNLPASSIADIRTAIFGPTSPDIIIRFSESIEWSSVSINTIKVVDAGAFVPGGGAPPAVVPAPGFPKLKSAIDQSSLPSNGFEVVWRADPAAGGLPFGTQVQVTVVGQRNTSSGPIVNGSPIKDRTGNNLDVSYIFQFQTIAPPDLPACPEPEYALYWSAPDRVGVLDSVNFKELAATILGTQTTQIQRNVLPERGDRIATKTTLGLSFDPQEISVDARTDAATCHTFAYVQSFQGGQVAILNTRTMLPVALINTPAPGGLSNQTGGGQSANVLLVTNSSANTMTEYDISNITPGRQYLNGPIFVSNVAPTGNTPKAISISSPAAVTWNREFGLTGPGVPFVMYADFTDGTVNTANLGASGPVRTFPLGTGASPNDISIGPCWGPPAIPPIMFAAVSEGGLPGEGKVAYYIAGPGCTTGTQTGARPDSLVGDLSGFDAPAGLDNIFSFSPDPFFAMAESGSTANRVVTLGVSTGAANLPRRVREFSTAANPTAIAHRASWFVPGRDTINCSGPVGNVQLKPPAGPCWDHAVAYTPAPCQYYGAEMYPLFPWTADGSGDPCLALYVCARGAGKVEVLDALSGTMDFYSPISIPGIRYIGSTCSE